MTRSRRKRFIEDPKFDVFLNPTKRKKQDEIVKNLTKKYSVVLGGKPWRDRDASGTAVRRQVWGCLLVPSPELHVGDGGNNKAYKVYLTLYEAALSQEEMVQISEIKERGLAHSSEYLQYKILMNFSRVEKFDHVRSQVRNMAD